jgi:acetoin utilization deacetylase AcuC-like enzyme
MTTGLVYDPAYLEHRTGRHPESEERLRKILEALEGDAALWESLAKISPRPAEDQDITRCHSSRLIDRIQGLCESGESFVDMDTVICAESFEVSRLAAGAALTSVDAVMTGQADNTFALVRPPGHHATPDTAMGFCLFNNAAIGARYAQARYGVERVVIIDWDVHHGNGTQDIFYRDPSVFYFSTHQYPYYPGTGSLDERGEGPGVGFNLNIPLSAGTQARLHREVFVQGLEIIEQKSPPDLIVISAGFDSRRGDPLGGLMLEDSDFSEMTKLVLELADKRSGKVISILEGGYNLSALGQTAKAHIQSLSS